MKNLIIITFASILIWSCVPEPPKPVVVNNYPLVFVTQSFDIPKGLYKNSIFPVNYPDSLFNKGKGEFVFTYYREKEKNIGRIKENLEKNILDFTIDISKWYYDENTTNFCQSRNYISPKDCVFTASSLDKKAQIKFIKNKNYIICPMTPNVSPSFDNRFFKKQ